MKARIRYTDTIIDVFQDSISWYSPDTRERYNDDQLDFGVYDWQAFRRDAAKDILAHMVIDERTSYSIIPYETMVKNAIKLADELIKQLRNESTRTD